MISLLKGEGEIYVFIKEEKAKGFKLMKKRPPRIGIKPF